MVYRTREIADTPEKGQTRYHLYKSVIDRYQEAMKAGFYLEAITLMESLITDRLESALIYYGMIDRTEAFRMLGDCIQKVMQSEILTPTLIQQLKVWKDNRNTALHEMAKIEVGTTPEFNMRYAKLKHVAIDGYNIFKSLNKELRTKKV